jgi:hypothetical protein
MKRITIAIAATIILGALTIALPNLRPTVQAKPVAKPAAPQIGPDHCGGVTFTFVNKLPDGEILKVVKIEYHRAVKNNWSTELISFGGNGECTNGAKCVTTGDSLADAKGVRLDTFKLHYQWRNNQNGANWSDTITSPIAFNEASGYQECQPNKNYGGNSWAVTK